MSQAGLAFKSWTPCQLAPMGHHVTLPSDLFMERNSQSLQDGIRSACVSPGFLRVREEWQPHISPPNFTKFPQQSSLKILKASSNSSPIINTWPSPQLSGDRVSVVWIQWHKQLRRSSHSRYILALHCSAAESMGLFLTLPIYNHLPTELQLAQLSDGACVEPVPLPCLPLMETLCIVQRQLLSRSKNYHSPHFSSCLLAMLTKCPMLLSACVQKHMGFNKNPCLFPTASLPK